LVLVALLGWMATACQVNVVAGVDVNRDGTGQVSAALGLDPEAVKEVGDVAAALRVDDLRQAGWRVIGPRKEDDGLTWVRATKPFAGPDGAGAAMAQLAGPNGPFRDFRLTRTRTLLRSRTTFTGVIDLTAGLTGLSDPELTDRLGDVDLGLDLDGLRRRFGDSLATSVKVQVTAGLPGKVATNAPSRDGGRALWSPVLGQSVRMEASSQALRLAPGLVAAAIGAFLVPILLATLAVRRHLRRRAR